MNLKESIRNHSAAYAEKEFESKDFPSEWRRKIGKTTFQLLPYDYAPAMIDAERKGTYRIQVQPCMQLYAASTPKLDRLYATSYDSENTPELICMELMTSCLDEGHLFLETSKTWDSIRRNYEAVASCSSHLLLKKRAPPLKRIQPSKKSIFTITQKQWFKLPSGEDLPDTFSLSWNQTIVGKLSTLFLRNTVVYMDSRYEDGKSIPIYDHS